MRKCGKWPSGTLFVCPWPSSSAGFQRRSPTTSASSWRAFVCWPTYGSTPVRNSPRMGRLTHFAGKNLPNSSIDLSDVPMIYPAPTRTVCWTLWQRTAAIKWEVMILCLHLFSERVCLREKAAFPVLSRTGTTIAGVFRIGAYNARESWSSYRSRSWLSLRKTIERYTCWWLSQGGDFPASV